MNEESIFFNIYLVLYTCVCGGIKSYIYMVRFWPGDLVH